MRVAHGKTRHSRGYFIAGPRVKCKAEVDRELDKFL